MNNFWQKILPIFACILLLNNYSWADDSERVLGIELGKEYSTYSKPSRGSASSTRPNESTSTTEKIIYYLPNRILDLLDIFRADVGVGFSFGGVMRATSFAQCGYRTFSPGSLRVGLRGRELPIFFESDAELGCGPVFSQSSDRVVTPAEFGVGVDLFIPGIYLGISFDEFADFVLGIFGVDFKDDDFD
jgi:hypothetical protein